MIFIDISNIKIRLGNYVLTLLHAGRAEFGASFNIIPHAHILYEFHYVCNGGCLLFMENGSVGLRKGDAYMTGPGIYHGQAGDRDHSYEEACVRFDIEYSPQNMSDKEESAFVKAIMGHPFFSMEDGQSQCGLIIRNIICEACERRPLFKKNLENLFSQFVVQIGRSCLEMKKVSAVPARLSADGGCLSEQPNLKARLDSCFFDYIHPMSVEQITDYLHISRRQFSRLMQKYYETSYTDKINELRIRLSKQLLTQTDLTIDEVRIASGYQTSQHFIIVFKRLTGMTPTEYRKKNAAGKLFRALY